MSANSFGQIFRTTSFGESHGPALGVVIDGCPAGLEFNHRLLQKNLDRRKPGASGVVSERQESDVFEILSGVFEGKTIGTPITIVVHNKDTRSKDYEVIKTEPRIGHADDQWKLKFGHTDHRGGGRSSGRETISRVLAGSVAQMLVEKICPKTEVIAWSQKIGPYEISSDEVNEVNPDQIEKSICRFPGQNEKQVIQLLEKAKIEGESYPGVVGVQVKNPMAGLGQPVFHKLKSDLSLALMSIGATTAIEFGSGFKTHNVKGTEYHTKMENSVYGGLRGGISTGESIQIFIHFKPTSSIKEVAKKGRHDPCLVIRAVPVVESMVWLTLADHLLWKRLDQVIVS